MSIKKKVENYAAQAVEDRKDTTAVLLKIPDSLLQQLDSVVGRKSWTTRTGWIMDAIVAKLDIEL